jgi:hypothetical protein
MYGIKKYGVEAIFNGMTYLLNFKKSTKCLEIIKEDIQADRDRRNGDLTNFIFIFKETMLKSHAHTKVWDAFSSAVRLVHQKPVINSIA